MIDIDVLENRKILNNIKQKCLLVDGLMDKWANPIYTLSTNSI